MNPPPLLLTPAAAADRLGICERTLWQLTTLKEEVPCLRLGRLVRYPTYAIAALLGEAPAELSHTSALTIDEAAAVLSISRRTCWRLSRACILPHARLGDRMLRYSLQALDEWIRANGSDEWIGTNKTDRLPAKPRRRRSAENINGPLQIAGR